jgi:hypothetical protein
MEIVSLFFGIHRLFPNERNQGNRRTHPVMKYLMARTGRSQGNLARTPDVAVVTPLNNFLGPEGDTVTADNHY